jgi:predicted nuclease of restriction endonuclease-like (RecB) superfamily
MGNQPSRFPDNYDAILNALKQRIRQAQLRAALAVNQELILLYWHIGSEILDRQQAEGWGTKVVERLARDLKFEFPDVKGFSRTNLLYMRAFAEAYPDQQVVQRTVGLIPWRHNIALIDKLKLAEERLWYAQQALEHGWSRDILAMTIGIILCRSKSQTIVEFALQDLDKPIGVASYRLREDLPTELQGSLPTIAQLEVEMATIVAEIESHEPDV